MSQGRLAWLCVVLQILVAIVLDVQSRPFFVDLQKAGAALPAPQDDQAWVGESVVGRLMNMADHHQIGRASTSGRVLAKDFHVAFFVSLQAVKVARLEDSIECLGNRPGNVRKRLVESAGFHPRLPNSPCSQEVAVDDSDTKAVQRHIVRLGDDRCPQLRIVERAEPFVVITGHDGQRAASTPEFGQASQALATQTDFMLMARTHPEIAKIAGDDQGIVGRQAV